MAWTIFNGILNFLWYIYISRHGFMSWPSQRTQICDWLPDYFKAIFHLLSSGDEEPSTSTKSTDETTSDYYSSSASTGTPWRWFNWNKTINQKNLFLFLHHFDNKDGIWPDNTTYSIHFLISFGWRIFVRMVDVPCCLRLHAFNVLLSGSETWEFWFSSMSADL